MKCLASVFLCAATAMPAMAQVAEVRAGIGAHDLRVLSDQTVKEDSGVINGEIIFEEPEFLKWALSPQPYIGGQLNLGGGTSYGGAGLLWRQNFGKKFYGDFSFGVVIHDGTLEADLPTIDFNDFESVEAFLADPQAQAILNERSFRRLNTLEYGSRILLREQLTLGYRLDEKWALEGYFEHVSHGNIWTDGPNDGSDAAGFRINRKF